MPKALKPQSDVERKIAEETRNSDVRPEFLRAVADEIETRKQSTHDAVVAAAPEAVKEESLTAMPFEKLKTLLAPKGIDLQKQLDDHVSFMVRMGVLNEKDAEQYCAKFQTISVRKSELENIPKGYKPMFFVDNMTPVQAAKTFITGQDINLYECSTLADFTKRDPNNPDKILENQSPSDLARLTFTPNVRNLTKNLTGKKADTRLDEMKQGKHFMEPAQWFQMFAECLDKAMTKLNLGNGKQWGDMNDEERKAILANTDIDQYLPDLTTWTQFPDYRNQYGSVLDLNWDPGGREVWVSSWSPGSVGGSLGIRPSLG
ncbi:hypothetical protein HZA39_02570 [Candidatus Peregrinibacteria bacterium]|nr:hypothetical protein [Candidatus Peregrinibacteria bacterium]